MSKYTPLCDKVFSSYENYFSLARYKGFIMETFRKLHERAFVVNKIPIRSTLNS